MPIDLSEFEVGDLDIDASPETAVASGPAPVVAVVGRPNVGKSTLVNRIIGRRQAVVEDVPGVTRDRVPYDANWNGRRFTVVDTGGWEPDAKDRAAAIAAQAEIAVQTADVVIFVVDVDRRLHGRGRGRGTMLRRSSKPVILVANKADNNALEIEATSLWSLGLGEPYPISALHGRGSGDLLDAILAAMPPAPPIIEGAPRGPRRVALVGRPNVGKSSLLNRVAREERAVVDSVAGTTVDPVDSLVEMDGQVWQFVDTAGLRKRVNQASGTEYYASLRTAGAVEAAEVAVVLLDAFEPISEQDQRVLTSVVEAGRALVIAFNKWDLVDADRRFYLDKEIDRELKRIPWAVRVNISAKTGRAVDKLAPALRRALASWEQRIADRCAEPVADGVDGGHAAPGPGWAGAADHVRDAGRGGAAEVRAVHDGAAGRGVPAVHRAQAARGVRVRGLADRVVGAASEEVGAWGTRQGTRVALWVGWPGFLVGYRGCHEGDVASGCSAAW